jgi:hypothetical protein
MNLDQEAGRMYDLNDDDALFRLAETHWPDVGQPLPPGIADVCRLAFARAIQKGRSDHTLWRARAMSACVLTGARDTAAGLVLQPFFVATAQALDGAENGHVHARGILEEVRRLVPDDTEAWSRLYARLYYEKRAFSFLMEATDGASPRPGAGHLLDAADAELVRALEHNRNDPRGSCKVRGGLALVRYLRLAGEPEEVVAERKAPFLEETRAVHKAASEAGYRDVEDWAEVNAGVMSSGEFAGWVAYEIA